MKRLQLVIPVVVAVGLFLTIAGDAIGAQKQKVFKDKDVIKIV